MFFRILVENSNILFVFLFEYRPVDFIQRAEEFLRVRKGIKRARVVMERIDTKKIVVEALPQKSAKPTNKSSAKPTRTTSTNVNRRTTRAMAKKAKMPNN